MDTEKQNTQLIPQTAWDMIWLIRCALSGAKPDLERVAQMDQKQLYRLAALHSLTALVGTALAGMDTGEMKGPWQTAVGMAVRKTMLFDAERSALLGWMEENGIWYMPLKGVVLKDDYPVYGIRQMADNDILFDVSRAEEVRDWFVARDYAVKVCAGGVHDCVP